MSKKLVEQAIHRAYRLATGAYGSGYKPTYIILKTRDEVLFGLEALLADVRENLRVISQDVESPWITERGAISLDPLHKDFRVWMNGISIDDYQSIVVPFDPDPDVAEQFGLTSITECPEILEMHREMARMNCLHHSTMDALSLARYGIQYTDLHDSMLVQYAIDDTAGDLGIDDLAKFYTEEGGFKNLHYPKAVPRAEFQWDKLAMRCAYDADIERRIFFILKQQAIADDVWGQPWLGDQKPRGYQGILKVSNQVGIEMTLNGAAIDRPHLEGLIISERQKQAPYIREFQERPEVQRTLDLIGAKTEGTEGELKKYREIKSLDDIKPSKPWIMAILFYDVCKYPAPAPGKNGIRPVEAEDLEKHRDSKPEHKRLVDIYLTIKRIDKKLSTYLLPYVQPKLDKADEDRPIGERIELIAAGKVERFEYIKPDGLVHPRFNVHKVRSGRLSSENPNFQNIINDILIKMMFVARLRKSSDPATASKRGVLTAGDFAQHEVRMAAWLCHDKNMIANLEKGFHMINLALLEKLIGPQDVPTITKERVDELEDIVYLKYLRELVQGLIDAKDTSDAMRSVLRGMPGDLFTYPHGELIKILPGEGKEYADLVDLWKNHFKKRKTVAKESTFGPLYGMQSSTFAAIHGLSRSEAEELYAIDRATYPDKHRFFEEVKARAAVDGFVQSIFGKKRRLDYKAARGDSGKIAELDRQAGNTVVQGPSSDIGVLCMERCMRRYKEEKLDVFPIGTVHDSLMNDSSVEDAEANLEIQYHVMTTLPNEVLGSDHVKFLAEMDYGPDWGHTKAWLPKSLRT